MSILVLTGYLNILLTDIFIYLRRSTNPVWFYSRNSANSPFVRTREPTWKVGYRTNHPPINWLGGILSEPLYHHRILVTYSVRTVYIATLTFSFFVLSSAIQNHRTSWKLPRKCYKISLCKSICKFENSTKHVYACCVKNAFQM